jgi:5-methylcytosine-specific restriction endonuclease McrA
MNEHFIVGTGSTRLYEPRGIKVYPITIPASLLLPPVSAPVQKVKTPVKGRKGPKKGRVERTRNGGTWTEHRYVGVWRSAVRRVSRFWVPKLTALKWARFSWPGPRGRKWGYTCAHCQGKFIRDSVEVDHIIPCGSLKKIEDLPAFIARALPEDPKAFQVLCKPCHRVKTLLDNESRK